MEVFQGEVLQDHLLLLFVVLDQVHLLWSTLKYDKWRTSKYQKTILVEGVRKQVLLLYGDATDYYVFLPYYFWVILNGEQ